MGSRANLKPIRALRSAIGTQLDPHSCWMLSRSLETVSLRMERAAGNAAKVAQSLSEHPKVARVHYPPLLPAGDPARALMERQSRSAGSTFSFEVKGGEAEAFAFLNRLEVFKLAVSLGGTESLDLPSGDHGAFRPDAGGAARDRDHAGPDPGVGRHRASRRSHRRCGACLRNMKRCRCHAPNSGAKVMVLGASGALYSHELPLREVRQVRRQSILPAAGCFEECLVSGPCQNAGAP